MAVQVPTSSEPGFTTLVREIVSDVEELAVGVASVLLGVLFLGMSLVHLLHWLTTPPGVELAGLPLWGCHAIVAGVFLITGAGLCLLGRKMFASITPLAEQTAQTLKENVEWITNSK